MNLSTLIQQLLPPSWRFKPPRSGNEPRLSWQQRLLETLLRPLEELLRAAQDFRVQTRSRIVGNMQVLPLQATLSKLYRGHVRLEHRTEAFTFYVRLGNTDDNASEAEIEARKNQIKTLLDTYKLGGTSYELTTLNN